MTVIAIDGVTGFRDVGGIPAATGTIRSGRLFRSGHLAGLGPDAADELRARVRRIVDLRADDEVADDVTAASGIRITRLPLYLGSARSFFLEDYSLGEIYAHLLSGSAAALVSAMRIIAAGEPTLVHCTAGKDRTGITIALALAAVGADRDAVVADYALTADLIPAAHRRATSERLAAKYPESRHAWMLATESPAEVMRATLANLDAQWGSAAEYLLGHALTREELAALRNALVTPHEGAPS
ncbi:tyrosine-protein phosphatase [Microbacterium sp. SD291]|uniref:tyrosine-protein phosphatase n=1 Tax=Microbacterium sp. SD291 TaxID=2782007 RepID=UPI001A96C288|nr:tyrosine-protein phosphatase [Microbacterium sp. SD291]MBO0979728.1 tyrosine-protein phosphatase [Microbacterium sp. SD291]